MKPNDTPLYVDRNSNHPPCILKNIPHSVNNRLSKISANEEVFLQACPPFQAALRKSGYDYQLNFNPPSHNQTKSNKRKRNILRFHPPYSQNVHTNIGQKFLKLVDENFPKEHPLSKIINRNCIKLGYRCMPNMKKAITRHNIQVLKSEEEPIQPGCNCSGVMGPCPLDGQCLVSGVVYRATVEDNNNNSSTYTGLTSNTFKKRYYAHRSTFENEDHENPTTLSSHIWDLKNKNKNYNIKWSIIDRAKNFNPATKKCRLCLKEKYYIIFQPDGATLNQRSELFSSCRHRLSKTLAKT